MSELVIKISGDLDNYEKALEEAEKKTDALNSQLTKLAAVSGVAFAALTAEIAVSVKAFGESEKASNKLTQALQNQGIYSTKVKEAYEGFAKEVQRKTGIDDDAVVAAEAVLQGLIGQQKVTQGLTDAIADLSVAKELDLNTTANLIGKGIAGHTAALQKLGIEVDEGLSKEERTAKILELVTQKYGGQAEAANKGIGSIQGLHTAFGNFQEDIGQRFAPLITQVVLSMTHFFQILKKHEDITNFIVSVIAAGTAVSGIVLAVSLGGIAFLKLQAALEAAKIATTAMTIATKGLVGATGLGIVLLIASELYLNWSTIWPKMQQIFASFSENVGGISEHLGGLLRGIIHFDPAAVKAELGNLKDVIAKGYAEITAAKPTEKDEGGGQEAKKAAAAAKANRLEIEGEKNKQAVLQAERELAVAKAGDASALTIQLKQQELDTLKQIQDNHNASIRGALQEHVAELDGAQVAAREIDLQKNNTFNQEILDNDKAYAKLSDDQKALFKASYLEKIKADFETEKSIKVTYAAQEVAADVARRKKFLQDEQEFGTAYAAINQVTQSKVYQGVNKATSELAVLVNSKNKELKAIGKAASVAQITIKTAESAMNVYSSLSAIPFVGPALGAAAAVAVAAYGAEQIGTVLAAAEGGRIEGGIPGIDSVPVLAQQGELIVPKNSYEEVVGAVADKRSGNGGSPSGDGGLAHVVISLRDDLMDFIEAKLVERQKLNISIQGA